MGIGKRIKEARNALNMTQEELAKKLGVTKGAIANYENETSHPKEPIMYKLFEALNVDANYLFQDVVNIPQRNNNVTISEYAFIEKYRSLDPAGQKHVDTVLQWEVDHSSLLSEKNTKIQNLTNRLRGYSDEILNAAHDNGPTLEQAAAADAIMKDPKEWG